MVGLSAYRAHIGLRFVRRSVRIGSNRFKAARSREGAVPADGGFSLAVARHLDLRPRAVLGDALGGPQGEVRGGEVLDDVHQDDAVDGGVGEGDARVFVVGARRAGQVGESSVLVVVRVAVPGGEEVQADDLRAALAQELGVRLLGAEVRDARTARTRERRTVRRARTARSRARCRRGAEGGGGQGSEFDERGDAVALLRAAVRAGGVRAAPVRLPRPDVDARAAHRADPGPSRRARQARRLERRERRPRLRLARRRAAWRRARLVASQANDGAGSPRRGAPRERPAGRTPRWRGRRGRARSTRAPRRRASTPRATTRASTEATPCGARAAESRREGEDEHLGGF